jgi:hypothetical protein
MDELRLGWIGDTRRGALFKQLSGLIEDWASDWWVGASQGAVELSIADDNMDRTSWQGVLVSRSGVGAAAVYLGGRTFDAVGRHLAATTSDDDSELAARLGEKAIAELVAAIHRRAGAVSTEPPAKAALPMALSHGRFAAFGVEIRLGRLQWIVLIDRGLGERMVPPVAQPPLSLHRRDTVLAGASVEIKAVMSLGSVDLASLAGLAVGELLIGDCRLDDPLHVHVEGKGAVATGFMRRLGTHRAIVIDGALSQEHLPS